MDLVAYAPPHMPLWIPLACERAVAAQRVQIFLYVPMYLQLMESFLPMIFFGHRLLLFGAIALAAAMAYAFLLFPCGGFPPALDDGAVDGKIADEAILIERGTQHGMDSTDVRRIIEFRGAPACGGRARDSFQGSVVLMFQLSLMNVIASVMVLREKNSFTIHTANIADNGYPGLPLIIFLSLATAYGAMSARAFQHAMNSSSFSVGVEKKHGPMSSKWNRSG